MSLHVHMANATPKRRKPVYRIHWLTLASMLMGGLWFLEWIAEKVFL